MNKNNWLNIIIGAALLFTIIIAFWVMRPLAIEKERQQPLVPSTSSQGDFHSYAGTGDPLRYRVQPSILNTGQPENGHTYAGTGDPFRFRVVPSIPNTGQPDDGHTYTGTGDPFRFRVVPSGDLQQVSPSAVDCFSPRFHAASDCDRIAPKKEQPKPVEAKTVQSGGATQSQPAATAFTGYRLVTNERGLRVVSPETTPTEGDKIYRLAEGYWLVINASGGEIIPPAPSLVANQQVKLSSGDVLVINEGYGHVILTGGPLKPALHDPNLHKEVLGGGFWLITEGDGTFILQAGSN